MKEKSELRMAEKDDGLGLSLSLKCPETPNIFAPPPPPPPLVAPQQPPAAASPSPFTFIRTHLPFMQQLQHKSSTTGAFQSFSDRNAESRALFRGIDMNRPVTVMEGDEEVNVVSSPNSTVSSLSGKRSEREENDGERESSSFEMEDDGGGDEAGRKKLRLTKEQGVVLEEEFKEHNTLNPKQKMALAKRLNLRPRQVEVWFQNRRARTKLKQTEVDCEYLRCCCDNLTAENRRLQKEVSELRALKLSPQFYMNTSPPTTLTMCPQCERVSSSSSAQLSSSAIAPSRVNRQGTHH